MPKDKKYQLFKIKSMENALLATIVGGLVVGLILYYIFGIGKSNPNNTYNVSSQGQTGGITAGEVNITTTKFSQSQSIKVLPPSLGGNDLLNLDNVAKLKLHVPFSMDSVTTLLDVVVTNLPDQHTDNFSVEGTQYYNQTSGTQYIFDTTDNKRHEIAVGGRLFTVTLYSINKLNIPNVPVAIEYQFGISEK
jgi:hypothetical protein